jgi:hypothetical protein
MAPLLPTRVSCSFLDDPTYDRGTSGVANHHDDSFLPPCQCAACAVGAIPKPATSTAVVRKRADNLGISQRTVESGPVMVEKMHARSLSALVRRVVAAGPDRFTDTG